MNDVEVTGGGCNPLSITSEYKTVDEKNIIIEIIIEKDYLTKATAIFQNWK